MAGRRPTVTKTAAKPPAKKTPVKRASTKKTAGPRSPSRDDQALKLHQAGHTLDAIAKKLRFRDATAAHVAYERALAKSLPEPPDRLKRAELERIRKAEEKLWPKAERGDLSAIAHLVNLDLERHTINRDQLLLTTGTAGPIEQATLQEVKRLSDAAPALAATALILAKTVDETVEPGPRATVARELRMHMSQLRGLAGTNPKFHSAAPATPDEDSGKPKDGGKRVVVPETELDRLRRRAAERASEAAAPR